MYTSRLKFIAFLTMLALFGAFLFVGTASASIMDYNNESDCMDEGYYWYDDTCYETENEKLSAQVTGLQNKIDELLDQIQEDEEEEEWCYTFEESLS